MARKGQVNVRLSVELVAALSEASGVLGISQAALIEQTMRERLAVILGRPVPPQAPHHRSREAAS